MLRFRHLVIGLAALTALTAAFASISNDHPTILAMRAGARLAIVAADRHHTEDGDVGGDDRGRQGSDDHSQEGAQGSEGLTGLANAVARVSRNLDDHPNRGLRNALDHLRANQQKDEDHEGDGGAEGQGKGQGSAGHGSGGQGQGGQGQSGLHGSSGGGNSDSHGTSGSHGRGHDQGNSSH